MRKTPGSPAITTVVLPRELRAQLRAIAGGRSEASVLRAALRRYLARPVPARSVRQQPVSVRGLSDAELAALRQAAAAQRVSFGVLVKAALAAYVEEVVTCPTSTRPTVRTHPS